MIKVSWLWKENCVNYVDHKSAETKTFKTNIIGYLKALVYIIYCKLFQDYVIVELEIGEDLNNESR